MVPAKILVIDDEAQIRKLLDITFHSNGYNVIVAANAREGIIAAANHQPDMIVLDLGLPDDCGHNVLTKLREWYQKPIIILSVINAENDIVSALDKGANDYLIKPFRTGELLARVRSALRAGDRQETSSILHNKVFEIDFASRTVKQDEQVLKLTATQYALLSLFAKNEGKVMTHQYILKEIWGEKYISELQYLRVFIAQLRKKIEKDPNHPKYLVSESGIGYRFTDKQVGE